MPQVNASLIEMRIEPITADLIHLAKNPLNLSLIASIKQAEPTFDFAKIASEMDLWERYAAFIDERETDEVLATGILLAAEALKSIDRSFSLPRVKNASYRRLISWEVIVNTEGRKYRFRHERLCDYLYASDAADELLSSIQIANIIGNYRSCSVIPIVAELYKRRNPIRYRQFAREVLLSDTLPFYAQEALFVKYSQSDSRHDKDVTDVVIEMLNTKPELYSRFLNTVPHYTWAEVLWNAGLLSTPPEIDPDAKYVPRWEAQDYLVKVASKAPQIVFNHLKVVSGQSWYVSQAIRATRQAGADTAAIAVEIVIHYLEEYRHKGALASDATEFLAYLVNEGKYEEALKVFLHIAMPQLIDKDFKAHFTSSVVGITTGGADWYQKTNDTHNTGFLVLVAKRPLQVAAIVEMAIVANLKIEASYWGHEDAINNLFWLDAIDDEIAEPAHEYRQILVCALRDAINCLVTVDADAARRKVQQYAQHEWIIFRRVELYMLWKWPSMFEKQVVDKLTNHANLHIDNIFHEFLMLLHYGFGHLSEVQQRDLVGAILNGPDEETERHYIAFNANLGPEEHAKSIVRLKERWIQIRLWALRNYLEFDAREHLLRLNELYGTSDLDRQKWKSQTGWVAETGPISYDQLTTLEPEGLLDLLNSWHEPPDRALGMHIISQRGLYNDVAKLITANWERYKGTFHRVIEANDEAATIILSQLCSNEIVPKIDWITVMPALSQLAKRIEYVIEEADISKGNTSRDELALQIVWLIGRGLNNQSNRIPGDLFLIAKQILICFANYRVHNLITTNGVADHHTSSLNNVRPRAIKLLIDWIHIVSDLNGERPVAPFDEDIARVITKVFEATCHEQPSIYSALGEQFAKLNWIDKDWTANHLDCIFPVAANMNEHFLTAWQAFIAHWQFNLEHMRLLNKQYERAVLLLIEMPVDKLTDRGISAHEYPQSLIAHCLLQYLYAERLGVSPDGTNQLIHRIIESNWQTLRETAAWVVWRFLYEDKGNTTALNQYWPRLKELLMWWIGGCVAQGNLTERDREMHSLASGISFLDGLESLPSLLSLIESLLPHLCRDRDEQGIAGFEEIERYLATQVDIFPIQTIQIYRRMVDNRNERYWYRGHDNARKLLLVAAKYPATNDTACYLLDIYARRGNNDYRDVFDLYCR